MSFSQIAWRSSPDRYATRTPERRTAGPGRARGRVEVEQDDDSVVDPSRPTPHWSISARACASVSSVVISCRALGCRRRPRPSLRSIASMVSSAVRSPRRRARRVVDRLAGDAARERWARGGERRVGRDRRARREGEPSNERERAARRTSPAHQPAGAAPGVRAPATQPAIRREAPAVAWVARCRWNRATPRTRRRQRSPRGRPAGVAAGRACRARRWIRRSDPRREPATGPAGAPREGRRRAARASSMRGSDGALHREPAGSARSCRRRGRSGAPPGRGRGGRARPANPLGRPAPDRVRSRCGPGDGRRGRCPAMAQLARETLGRGCRFTGRTDREPATEIDGVEVAIDPRHRAASASAFVPRRATRRPRRAATRRGDGCPGAEAAVRAAAGIDRAGDLGLGHAELRATRSDGQPGERLG